MRRNLIALLFVLLILVALPAGLFGYQALRNQTAGVRVIEIVAHIPEDGGFSPDHLTLKAGETVRLRISSPDVVHGFAIPDLGVEVREILPGKPVDVDVTPQRAGRYAFACIRWCSVDHWRMRGVIEVVGGEPAALTTIEPPLYQTLGLDLDATRDPAAVVPSERPSAGRGAALEALLPANLSDRAQRRTVTPVVAFQQMRADPKNRGYGDQQIWDLVAYVWLKDFTNRAATGTGTAGEELAPAEALVNARRTYAQECAACHGPEGKGDGPAGRNLPGLSKMDPQTAAAANGVHATAGAAGMDGIGPSGPADFTNAGRILAASDALLQGKMLRGGMGTGMPEFGSLYKDDQLWGLVAYIRTFIFKVDGR
jgi:mono/diheme cytochrome c family protein